MQKHRTKGPHTSYNWAKLSLLNYRKSVYLNVKNPLNFSVRMPLIDTSTTKKKCNFCSIFFSLHQVLGLSCLCGLNTQKAIWRSQYPSNRAMYKELLLWLSRGLYIIFSISNAYRDYKKKRETFDIQKFFSGRVCKNSFLIKGKNLNYFVLVVQNVLSEGVN